MSTTVEPHSRQNTAPLSRFLGSLALLFNRRAIDAEIQELKSLPERILLPLHPTVAHAARRLRDELKTAEALPAAVRETLKSVDFSSGDNLLPLTDIAQQIEKLGVNIGNIILRILMDRAKDELNDAAKARLPAETIERYNHARELLHLGKKGLHHVAGEVGKSALTDAALGVDPTLHAGLTSVLPGVAAGIGADSAAVPPDGASSFDPISSSLQPSDHFRVLSAFDDKFVDVLSQLGVVDALEGVHELAINTLPLGVALFDGLADLSLFPGMFSSGKAIIKEIDMLIDNQTSFEDSFAQTFAPLIVKTLTLVTALALDAASGGTSMGLFVVGTLLYNTFSNNSRLKDLAAEQWNELHSYQKQIHGRKEAATKTINEVVKERFVPVQQVLSDYPILDNQPAFKVFAAILTEARAAEAAIVSRLALEDCAKRVAGLKPSNWLDSLLGIDRNLASTEAFTEAAHEVGVRVRADAGAFAVKLASDPSATLKTLHQLHVVRGGDAAKAIAGSQDWLGSALDAHAALVVRWQNQCTGAWQEATAATARATEKESGAVSELVQGLEPKMKPLRRALAATMKRLGQEIAIPNQ